MMSDLADIQKGSTRMPRRVMLYGTHGIGKTTVSSGLPSVVFLQTEDGMAGVEADRFPIARDLASILASLRSLYAGKHEYKTLVIDSVDWLERLIWQEVCEEKGKTSIEEVPYGKGYVFALDQWRRVLRGLDALRESKEMSIVLLAHAAITRFESPETDAYDRFGPRLHKTASALLQEWCDEVLFATYKVRTRTTGEGFQKRTKAIGDGERVLHTCERPAHLAKNRLGLPAEMPFDKNTFRDIVLGINTTQEAKETNDG